MNVVEELGRALDNNDWKIVARVFTYLESQSSVKNIEGDSRVMLTVEQGTIQPPKKRGRPKKVKAGDIVVAGNQVGEVINDDMNDTHVILEAPKRNKVEGQKIAARFEPFQPPKGPNLFDPKRIKVPEEPNSNKINDNVPRSIRTRKPVNNVRMVFCEDCKQQVNIYPDKERTPFYCEYRKFGKTCPRK